MLIKRIFYKDWNRAQEDMHKASDMGFDAWMYYNPNEKGWYVTYKTLVGK
jgi:hypothetical protein